MCHPVRQHFLLLRGLGRLSLVVFWRTDEGVCPCRLALSLIKGTPFSIWRGRFFVLKRGFLHIKETPSLFANSSIYSPLHSERGRGWGFFSLLGGGWLCFNLPLLTKKPTNITVYNWYISINDGFDKKYLTKRLVVQKKTVPLHQNHEIIHNGS